MIDGHDRCPHIRRVTIVTGSGRINMCLAFAGRRNPVMAGIAGTQDLYVINGEYGRPYCWAMAIFADVGRQNMRRILTGRLCAKIGRAHV